MQHEGSTWTASAVTEALRSQRCGTDPAALPEPRAGWPAVVDAVFRHRVHGLLAPRARHLGAPEPVADRISAAQRAMFRSGMAAVRDTALLSELLHDAGVDHLIVKGAALTATVGELPALRGGGDIDLWVKPEHVEPVELLARQHGWRRRPISERLPQPGEGWRWNLFLAVANEHALDHSERITLDLHWRLAERQAELGFDFDQAYERSVPAPSVGPTVRTTRLEDTFVHIAQHGRKEAWPTLRHLVDVVRLADVDGIHRTRSLAARHRNVQLALLTASHIAPDLAQLAGNADARTRALAEEAWSKCLSLEFPLSFRQQLRGREARRSRLRYESWLARSAPDWSTRSVWAGHLIVPLRAIVDPDPPILSIPRSLVRRLRQPMRQ